MYVSQLSRAELYRVICGSTTCLGASFPGGLLLRAEFADHGVPGERVRVNARVRPLVLYFGKGLSIRCAWHVSSTEPLGTRGELSLDIVECLAEVSVRGSRGGHRGLSLGLGLLLLSRGRVVLVELRWVESLAVEVSRGRRGGGCLSSEHLGHLVNSDLSVALVVPRSDVAGESLAHLGLTCDQDVVPLGQLRVSDLLVNVSLGAVKLALVAQLVEVQVD